jgi:hypothetical protein
MLGVAVRIGVNDHIINSEALAGLHDSDGYLSAIGDQYFALHEKPLSSKL